MLGIDPLKLRKDLRESDEPDLHRRRGIIALSVFGAANLALSSLVQMGLAKRLPEAPISGFDTNKVSLSDDAYRFGLPDGPLGVADFGANIALAAFGDADRAEKEPLIPLVACAKSVMSCAAAAWYVYRMPTKEKAWCIYCLATAAAEVGVLALTIPEAIKAINKLGERQV